MEGVELIVERHEDGYVGYATGLRGIVVADGETDEEARANLLSAVAFHRETFGEDA